MWACLDVGHKEMGERDDGGTRERGWEMESSSRGGGVHSRVQEEDLALQEERKPLGV